MRKTKMIKIDGREVTVRELRVVDLFMVLDSLEGGTTLEELRGRAEVLLPLACDLPWEAVGAMAPSEIQEIFEAFREVNAVFFGLARSLGLGEMLAKLKASMQADFAAAFAASLRRGTPAPQITE